MGLQDEMHTGQWEWEGGRKGKGERERERLFISPLYFYSVESIIFILFFDFFKLFINISSFFFILYVR